MTLHVIALSLVLGIYIFFFFNDTATTEIYTLSLHDALPISAAARRAPQGPARPARATEPSSIPSLPTEASARTSPPGDRKSTRLNSSHLGISYAVFCLKKKKISATAIESIHDAGVSRLSDVA